MDPEPSQQSPRLAPTHPALLRRIDDDAYPWPRVDGKHRVLTVGFIQGSQWGRDHVKEVVLEHCHKIPMGISFQFVESAWASWTADIRVSLGTLDSWSKSGREAELVPNSQATMYINMSPAIKDATAKELRLERQRTILRHFGHALGMVHEHRRLDSGILWNDEKLLEDLETYDKVREKYGPIEDRRARELPYDEFSIMHYDIHPLNTMNLSEPPRKNFTLSEMDKRYLQMVYPLEP